MSTTIKIVNVYLDLNSNKVSVGKLVYKNRNIYFEYDKDFLKGSLEISPYKLPLKKGVFVCEDKMFDGLWGVFADSLPDGWGRLLMDRHFMKQNKKLNNITPLDRLSYVGKFGIGALSYEPEFDTINLYDKDILLDNLAQSTQEILGGSGEEMVDELLLLGGSSAGARPKVMIQLHDNKTDMIHGAQTLQDGYSHWMVKFAASTDTKDIGLIEYAYSLMAKDAGITMNETTLLKGKQNSYFAIKRFDREGDNQVHLHSAAGLIHSDFRYPILDYDDLLTLTLHLTKDVMEQKKLFRLACFNLFAYNRDDHAKNFSFLMDKTGNWKLAPAYDLTFSNGPGGEHSTTYLGIGKNPTTNHLLKLADKHHIDNAKEIIQEIKKIINNWQKYAKCVNLNKSTTKSINSHLY